MTAVRQPLTKTEARRLLMQAREDVAALIQRRSEDMEEAYRLLSITADLYVGLTGEEAPEFRMRGQLEVAS